MMIRILLFLIGYLFIGMIFTNVTAIKMYQLLDNSITVSVKGFFRLMICSPNYTKEYNDNIKNNIKVFLYYNVFSTLCWPICDLEIWFLIILLKKGILDYQDKYDLILSLEKYNYIEQFKEIVR